MIDYAQLSDFVIVLLAICGAVVLVGNAIKTVGGWLQPVADRDERIERVEDFLTKDKERLDDMEETYKLLLEAISQLIEHEISGNDIDGLRAVHKKLTKWLIDRRSS